MKRKFRLPLRGREWLLFATSLVLALLIWFLSNLSRSYSGVLGVPVVAECNLQGYSNVSSNSAMLSARCRAEGFRLLREGTRRSRRPVRVAFDRADLRQGSGERFFVTGNVMNNYLRQIFGDKVDVEDIVTDTLFFVFTQENNKRVPVNYTGDFSYRSQYMASGPLKITPDSVTVYGEQARLDLVDHVSTAQIFVDDVHEAQHGTLRLRKIKGQGRAPLGRGDLLRTPGLPLRGAPFRAARLGPERAPRPPSGRFPVPGDRRPALHLPGQPQSARVIPTVHRLRGLRLLHLGPLRSACAETPFRGARLPGGTGRLRLHRDRLIV